MLMPFTLQRFNMLGHYAIANVLFPSARSIRGIVLDEVEG